MIQDIEYNRGNQWLPELGRASLGSCVHCIHTVKAYACFGADAVPPSLRNSRAASVGLFLCSLRKIEQ